MKDIITDPNNKPGHRFYSNYRANENTVLYDYFFLKTFAKAKIVPVKIK